ncbi:MAG: KamA family radical SAM protein [Pseudomonadales bacterium]
MGARHLARPVEDRHPVHPGAAARPATGRRRRGYRSGLSRAGTGTVSLPHAARRRQRSLLRQVLATLTERETAAGYLDDALAEQAYVRAPGLIQKYRHRALLMASPACAVHCRYCFRRNFPYDDHAPANWQAAIATIRDDTTLTEVILSGGDPLTLPDPAFDALFRTLGAVAHLRRLRIHTRLPVVLPQRTTAALLTTLSSVGKPVTVVIHCNHARELDTDTGHAFSLLRDAGCTLLNQAVLLRGINDSAQAQIDLAETLFAQGVLPYYLHLLDRVRGTHEFEVTETDGVRILRDVHAALPGYLVPRLVRETPGAAGKNLIPMP